MNFGIRLFDDSWLNFGYMSNPIGVESNNPILNYVSSTSVGSFFEPGGIIGIHF